MLELQSVTYEIDSRIILRDLSCSFVARKYGLVGANGVGKTTLVRLLAGGLEPTSGHVLRSASVAHLAQQEARGAGVAAGVLAEVWSAGPAQPELVAELVRPVEPDRPLQALSGGEWIRLRIARALALSPSFFILDEPTNDLDRDGRDVVLRLLRQFDGGMLVVSHDRELLRAVDEVLELKPSGLARYGGTFDLYWQQRTAARDRQEDDLRRARRQKREAARELVEKLERQDRRMRAGARKAAQGGIPRVLAGGMKRRAQTTAGKVKEQAAAAVDEAEAKHSEALEAVEADPFVRLDFESEAPPQSRVFFEARDLNLRFDSSETDLWPAGLDFLMKGRERWHIRGKNGSGKSTLLRLLMGEQPGAVSGALWRSQRPFVYLDQGLGLLHDDLSVLDNLSVESRFPPVQLRNELAFYGFKGDKVHQPTDTLSGGERLRAALARCFLCTTIPEIILLDEPTNNLDFQSLDLLEAALSKYGGLLVVVSHDTVFVGQVGVTHEVVLG